MTTFCVPVNGLLMKKPIDLYIENLKRLAGANSDTELAKSLALSKQAIAAWRRRESVPLAQQRILTALYGPEAAFDEDIGYVATQRERVSILSAFLRLFDRYRPILDPSENKEAYETWADVLLAFEDEMKHIVRQGGWIGVSPDGTPSEFTESQIASVLTALVQEKQDQTGILKDLLRPEDV